VPRNGGIVAIIHKTTEGAGPSLSNVLVETILKGSVSCEGIGHGGKAQIQQTCRNNSIRRKMGLNGGIMGTYSFVTVGLNAYKNKNTVQSTKLTFRAPEKAKKL
jgi:hypothetical protein